MNALEERTALPGRYQRARHHVVDDVFDDEFQAAFSEWLKANARLLEPVGGPVGAAPLVGHFLTDLEEHCPLTPTIREKLLQHLPDALDPCGVEAFEPKAIDMHAGVHHHACAQPWHDEQGVDRKLGYAFFLHTLPRRFAGGGVELFTGTVIEPRCNRLLFFDPVQRRRVQRVDCWSGELLCGRWSIFGWVG